MPDFTKIVRPYFRGIDKKMLRMASEGEPSQRATLCSLLKEGSQTDWGRRHGFAPGLTYEQWRERCPMVDYEAIRQDVMRMVGGEADVLWPGVTQRFAQSSGTSGGKSKYIPITRRGLARSHYRGGADVVARYLTLHPESRLMSGRALILGGSMATSLPHPAGVKAGDLSAHLIECINPLAGLLRVPKKRVALMESWEEKLPRLVADVAYRDVTNLSGVPSWMLTVLKEVLRYTGTSTIDEVWPHLEVFFHGGIAFGPYREEYKRIIGSPTMRYLETYNASEGFFGVQLDPVSPAMLLLMDVDTFYELIPTGGSEDEVIPVWDAEAGKDYELVITSSNGLWRYRIGDTIHIVATKPLTFTISGRTQQYINAFGEELMVHNAEAAFTRACRELGVAAVNFTAAPVYPTPTSRGRHEWLIEWITPPSDPETFAEALDAALRDENSDYDAKRTGGIFLDRLTIESLSPGTFDRWLASTGKLGGQRKVPRLCPDRRYIDPIKSFATN